jgi:hypothetical protein
VDDGGVAMAGKKKGKKGVARALVKPLGRDVPDRTRLFLFVRAGGRCEFDGCNAYLIQHHLTNADGIFAQMAHIWAFSDGGPRAKPTAVEKHASSNLMLLCSPCHKLVDDDPARFTADVLRAHKKAHEDRMFTLTDAKPDRSTVGFVLRARIGGQAVSISRAEMEAAVTPRYLGRDFVECDLTTLPDQAQGHFWEAAKAAIAEKAKSIHERKFEGKPASHFSVFALAPIPLLIFLGNELSNKVPTTLYQRHRDTENWRWKETGSAVDYETRKLRVGTDATRVALLLSLSGRIKESELPSSIDNTYTVIEVSLKGQGPKPQFLETEAALHAFRDEFLRVMRELVAEHPDAKSVALFPAIPAPIAVAVGRDLMPKRDPSLLVFDFDKRVGGFTSTLEVNQ